MYIKYTRYLTKRTGRKWRGNILLWIVNQQQMKLVLLNVRLLRLLITLWLFFWSSQSLQGGSKVREKTGTLNLVFVVLFGFGATGMALADSSLITPVLMTILVMVTLHVTEMLMRWTQNNSWKILEGSNSTTPVLHAWRGIGVCILKVKYFSNKYHPLLLQGWGVLSGLSNHTKPIGGFLPAALRQEKLQKKHLQKTCKCLILLARPEGFEPPTCGFEVYSLTPQCFCYCLLYLTKRETKDCCFLLLFTTVCSCLLYSGRLHTLPCCIVKLILQLLQRLILF